MVCLSNCVERLDKYTKGSSIHLKKAGHGKPARFNTASGTLLGTVKSIRTLPIHIGAPTPMTFLWKG